MLNSTQLQPRLTSFAGNLAAQARSTWQDASAAMEFHVFAAVSSNGEWARVLRAIRRELPQASILRVKDGEQAARFLFQKGLLSAEPQRPHLILIGSDIEPVSARELVSKIVSHPQTQFTPVIMLSLASSNAAERIANIGSRVVVIDCDEAGRFESSVAESIRKIAVTAER